MEGEEQERTVALIRDRLRASNQRNLYSTTKIKKITHVN